MGASLESDTAASASRKGEHAEDIMGLVGMSVTIQGLHNKPELNGVTAKVLSYDSSKKRYAVVGQGLQQPILLQKKNLFSIKSGIQPPGNAKELVGKQVLINDLKSKAEWNGRIGVVQSYCSQSDRCVVLIDGVDDPKLLQPKNLSEAAQDEIDETAPKATSELFPNLKSTLKDFFSANPGNIASKMNASADIAREQENFQERCRHNRCKIEDVLNIDMPVFSGHGCQACFSTYMYVYAGTSDLVELYYEREVLKSLCSYQQYNLRKRTGKNQQPSSSVWQFLKSGKNADTSIGFPDERLYREWVSCMMLEEPRTRSPNFAALKQIMCNSADQSDIIVGILLVAAGDYLSDSDCRSSYDHEFSLIRLGGEVHIIDSLIADPNIRKDPGGDGGFWHRTGVPIARRVHDVCSFLNTLQDFINQPGNPATLASMFGLNDFNCSDSEKSEALKLATTVHHGKWTSTQTKCWKEMFHVDFSEELEMGEAEHAPLLIWRSCFIDHSSAQSRYRQIIKSGTSAEELHKQHCDTAETRFQKISFEDRFQEYHKHTGTLELPHYSFDFD